VMCNNAVLHRPSQSCGDHPNAGIGDPMEVALLSAAAKAGVQQSQLLQDHPEVRKVAFDADTKMMATLHQLNNGTYQVAVKGAPESVLTICTTYLTVDGAVGEAQVMSAACQHRWQTQCTQLAEQGLRILAIATKVVETITTNPYENLMLLGIVGFEDPPRQDVKGAIAACHKAGIRVIMVTGDQPLTALHIGLAVGLTTESRARVAQGHELKHPDELLEAECDRLEDIPIFARVSPEQKLNLVALHQHHGSIVAMTGDGVNDAPALKKADIGVAMGQRGTQVAREAADMVLQDDAFATIVAAVEEGRAIFQNIRKFTFYLLSGNIGEILAVAAVSLTQAPLPILPLQILFLNAVNDVFPALALGVGEGSPTLMQHPPRDPEELVLTQGHWLVIIGYGVVIATAMLGIFTLCLKVWPMSEEKAVTIAFLSLAFGRLWHVFNMRDQGSQLLRNEITTNPYIWGALLICTMLLLFAVYFPPLALVLQVQNPGLFGWGLIAVTSLLPLIVGQIGLQVSQSDH
jgi:Ca2+-transporting ATPase